jgi:hypothetical protein
VAVVEAGTIGDDADVDDEDGLAEVAARYAQGRGAGVASRRAPAC